MKTIGLLNVLGLAIFASQISWAGAPAVTRTETRTENGISRSAHVHEVRSISVTGKDTQAVVTGTGFRAVDIEINGISGRVLVSELSLIDVQGNVIDLDTLLENQANAAVFKRGQIDRTGAKSIPGKIRLSLPGSVVVKQVNSVLQGVAVTGRDPNETRSVSIALIARGVTTAPPPTLPDYEDPYEPTNPSEPSRPEYPPTTQPAPSCDMNSLQRDLGRCEANRDVSRREVSQMNRDLSFIQGQISGLAYQEPAYLQCDSRRSSLKNEIDRRRNNVQAMRERLHSARSTNRSLSQAVNERYANTWRCYIVGRHTRGNVRDSIARGLLSDEQVLQAGGWQLTKEGTPGRILAEISANCGHNACGKNDWDRTWGCAPVR